MTLEALGLISCPPMGVEWKILHVNKKMLKKIDIDTLKQVNICRLQIIAKPVVNSKQNGCTVHVLVCLRVCKHRYFIRCLLHIAEVSNLHNRGFKLLCLMIHSITVLADMYMLYVCRNSNCYRSYCTYVSLTEKITELK